MAYTLNGTDLGIVKSERHGLSGSLEAFPTPFSESFDAYVDDYNGVLRTISVSGEYYSTTRANIINNFIKPIEALKNGNQTSPVPFVSDFLDLGTGTHYDSNGGFMNVRVESFDWEIKGGSSLTCEYTIVLIEGDL